VKPVLTVLQTLGALLVAAGVAVWALHDDVAGTFENFIADIMLAAAAAVGFRMVVVRRARDRESRDLSNALNDVRDWLAMLQEHVQGARSWSARRLAQTDDTRELLDLMFDQDRPRVKWDLWAHLTESVEDLAAEHGTIDFAPLVERIAAKYAVMWEAVGVVDTGLKRPERPRPLLPGFEPLELGAPPDGGFLDAAEVNSALETLHKVVVPVADDVSLLSRGLDEGYPPEQTAAKMLPDDFPLAISIAALALGAVALLIWVISAVRPETFPRGFSSAILGNFLPGCVGLAIGGAVAAVTGYLVRRNRAQRSKVAVSALVLACAGFVFSVSKPPEQIDIDGLRPAAVEISGCVNQLQHVRADARLQRYSFLLLRSINAFLDGKLKASLDLTFDLRGTPYRVPTPSGSRLATLAGRVSTRTRQIYLSEKW
jgi:hypothetical protein